MSDLLNLDSNAIQYALKFLLKDKTTQKNIVWATNSYSHHGADYAEDREITLKQLVRGLSPIELQPRVEKEKAAQNARTRKKAEVMTPSWICNKMNNHCDTEWFGREDVFNTENEHDWTTKRDRIAFPEGKTWRDYVYSRRIEITCGEAPYIVSRYDTTTGEPIVIEDRIGMLDRKLRVINENVADEQEWIEYVVLAFQSVYGYEFQGDNLLIARINLVNTFVEYLDARWHRVPTPEEMKKICNIIVWNFWQMDGLTNTIPYAVTETEEPEQITMFEDETPKADTNIPADMICRIMDWRCNYSVPFTTRKRERKTKNEV